MTQTTTLSRTSGFTMARIFGATTLALGIMLGIIGASQSAKAALLDPLSVQTETFDAGPVNTNYKGGHGFKTFGLGHRHGFKTFGFKGHGVRRY